MGPSTLVSTSQKIGKINVIAHRDTQKGNTCGTFCGTRKGKTQERSEKKEERGQRDQTKPNPPNWTHHLKLPQSAFTTERKQPGDEERSTKLKIRSIEQKRGSKRWGTHNKEGGGEKIPVAGPRREAERFERVLGPRKGGIHIR